MRKELLIIFVKNPLLGKVKTRLAKTIGEEKALQVYHNLLTYTHQITKDLNCNKAVYYSQFVDEADVWDNNNFNKFVQVGSDLGAKMAHAFENAFENKYEKVIIIGSDCFELDKKKIEEAFNQLCSNDVVLGPAVDGGYYLLGMKKLCTDFFIEKKWSSEDVLLDTILDINKNKLSYKLLDVLRDIDEEEDIEKSGMLIT